MGWDFLGTVIPAIRVNEDRVKKLYEIIDAMESGDFNFDAIGWQEIGLDTEI